MFSLRVVISKNALFVSHPGKILNEKLCHFQLRPEALKPEKHHLLQQRRVFRNILEEKC